MSSVFVITARFDDYEVPETPVAVFTSKEAALQEVARLNEPYYKHPVEKRRRPSKKHYFYSCYGPFELNTVFAFNKNNDHGFNAETELTITE